MKYREIKYKGKVYYTKFVPGYSGSYGYNPPCVTLHIEVKFLWWIIKKQVYKSKSVTGKGGWNSDWKLDKYKDLETYQKGATYLIDQYLKSVCKTDDWLEWDHNLTPDYEEKIKELESENQMLKEEIKEWKSFREEFREKVEINKEYIKLNT